MLGLEGVSTLTTTDYVTSTRIIPTNTAVTKVVVTHTSSILDGTYTIEPTSGKRVCYYVYWNLTLDAGDVHVSYDAKIDTEKGYDIDFWIFDESQWHTFESRKYCPSENTEIPAVFERSRGRAVSAYDSAIYIPTAGEYYFVFMSYSGKPVSLTLNVSLLQHTELMSYSTMYSTQTVISTVISTTENVFTTQTTSSSYTTPPDFTMVIIGGAIVTIAIIVALLLMRRRRVPTPASTYQPPSPAPEVPQARAPVTPTLPPLAPGVQPPVGKFCINCGAPLPVRATFCNKCGTKQ